MEFVTVISRCPIIPVIGVCDCSDYKRLVRQDANSNRTTEQQQKLIHAFNEFKTRPTFNRVHSAILFKNCTSQGQITENVKS